MATGDHLVHQCPTWQWATGEEKYIKPYLPRDKQYLVTKNGNALVYTTLDALFAVNFFLSYSDLLAA